MLVDPIIEYYLEDRIQSSIEKLPNKFLRRREDRQGRERETLKGMTEGESDAGVELADL